MSSKANITIAIVGGGLGGVTAAIALGRTGYNVHLIEQAAEFSEIGAGVGIGPNSFNAFQLLGIGEEYAQVADEVPSWFRYLNWNDGAEITHVMAKGTNTFVHRKRVLEVLLKLVPSNVTKRFSSHVTEVKNIPATDGKPARVLLQILPSELHHHPDWPADPWSLEVDAVIGCDGIKSTVRNSIKLGDGPDRGGRVRYTGTYAYRGLLPMEEAAKQCGELVREPLLWLAPNKHILSFPVEGGSIVNIVAFVSDRSAPPDDRQWTEGAWVKPVEMDVMLSDFKDWDKIPTTLLKLIDKPQQWALHELVPLERWTNDRITLLGDSAHASLPHNGAGAGQAIEDAYVLGELLALPECTAETIPHFLQAYEDVRRERASKQQIHSRNSGEIYDYVSPLGDDKARIAEQLQTHYDWIWVHDHQADVENAKIGLKSAGVL